MARLHQASDGHYYIKGTVNSQGAFATWQITDTGVNYLRRNGVTVDEVVPPPLFRYLRESGAAFTGGSGIGNQEAVLRDAGIDVSAKVLLAIRDESQGWQIGLAVSELPNDLFLQDGKPVGSPVLASRRLAGPDGVSASQMELWPGAGGKFLPVAHLTTHYELGLSGPWLDQHRVRMKPWTVQVPGLDPAGTLFRSQLGGGYRLRAHSRLELGESYFVVARAGPNGWKPSNQLLNRSLGISRGWEAWLVKLPDEVNEAVKSFARRMGHDIFDAVWKLSLAYPVPIGHSAAGIMEIPIGEALIVAAPRIPRTETTVILSRQTTSMVACPVSDPASAASPAFVAMSIGEPGLYSLSGRDVAPLLFVASSQPQPTGSDFLHPMRVEVEAQGTTTAFDAYVDSTPDVINCIDRAPTVKVYCPVPISLSWQIGTSRGHQERLPADALSATIAELWSSARKARAELALDLDAGTFGRSVLRFLCHAAPTQGTSVAAAGVADSVSAWLMRRRAARPEPLVPIPDRVAARLQTTHTSSRVPAYVRARLLRLAQPESATRKA